MGLKIPSVIKFTFATIVFAFYLSACGGGGGSSDSSSSRQDPEGIWTGTFTDSGVTYNFAGVFYNNKFLGLSIDAGALYTGNYGMSGSQLTASVDQLVIGGGFDSTVDVTGTVSTRDSITGSTSGPGGSSTFSLQYDDIWERGTDLSDVAGTYSLTEGLYTFTLTVDPNGSYTGSDTDGCVYNGTISQFDPAINYYSLTVTVTSCGTFNGTYSGTSFLGDFNTTNEVLWLIIDDPDFILVSSPLRQ